VWQAQLDGWLAPARQALGNAADAAWATGHALSLEESTVYALAEEEASAKQGVKDGAPGRKRLPGGLTEREAEVLRLVTAGKTNRQIAADLVLSEKTVARHLNNIFDKLGVSSRAAATAFALREGIA
ncbi:MAG: response regulator transcription factor, partial [Chloroflexota bacterium]